MQIINNEARSYVTSLDLLSQTYSFFKAPPILQSTLHVYQLQSTRYTQNYINSYYLFKYKCTNSPFVYFVKCCCVSDVSSQFMFTKSRITILDH
jgi:hypothetical protein